MHPHSSSVRQAYCAGSPGPDILSLRCQRASGRWNDFVAPGAPGTDPGLRAAV